jgi:hypothetical protein
MPASHRPPRSLQGTTGGGGRAMTPEERLDKIEVLIEKQNQQVDKQNEAIRGLIAVGRTCLDSIKEMREVHEKDYEELRKAQAATDEKLNILIDTVDRIIRHKDNGKTPPPPFY